jgi:hypothetical protein
MELRDRPVGTSGVGGVDTHIRTRAIRPYSTISLWGVVGKSSRSTAILRGPFASLIYGRPVSVGSYYGRPVSAGRITVGRCRSVVFRLALVTAGYLNVAYVFCSVVFPLTGESKLF